jgi:hypothetical protein
VHDLRKHAKTTPAAADTSLLDELPLAGDVLPRLPPRLRAMPLAAFDISITWNKTAGQTTVHAEITQDTLHAVTEASSTPPKTATTTPTPTSPNPYGIWPTPLEG